MDFDTLHLLITAQWSHAESNIDQILPLLEAYVSDVAALTPEQATKLRESFPSILGKLIGSRRVNYLRALTSSTNKLISVFFQQVVPSFLERPNEILDQIIDVAKNESFFTCEGIPNEGYTGKFAATPTPSFFHQAEQVELLGSLGLFDLILQVLNAGTREVPLTTKFMRNALHLIYSFRKVLNIELLQHYIITYRDIIYRTFMELDEDHLKLVTKQDIHLIVQYVDGTIKKIFHTTNSVDDNWEEDMARISTKFCADFALKCFKSTFLEKRIHGLVYIEDAVREIPGLWSQKKKVSLEWILENKIVEMIFDIKNTRDQLITKGKPIIKYIVEERKLSDEMLELIWSCTMDKYLATATFEIICGHIATSPHYQLLIWNKLKSSLAPQDWTEQIINSIYRIVEQDHLYAHLIHRPASMIPLEEAVHWFLYLIEAPTTPLPVVQVTMEKLILLVKDNPAMKEKLCKAVLVDIFDSNSTQKIFILRGLMKAIPMMTNNDPKILFREFIQENDLITLLCKELGHYHKSARVAIQDHTKLDGIMSQTLVGRFTHTFSLEHRLKLITRCVDFQPRATRTLPNDLIEYICSHLLDLDCSLLQEREMAYDWFKKLCFPSLSPKHRKIHLLPESISFFFRRWLCKQSSYGAMTLKGLECFQTYFLAVNVDLFDITLDFNKTIQNFVALKFEYEGWLELYKLILFVEDNDVFTCGRHILIKLFTKFFDTVRPELPNINRVFLNLIMDGIESALKDRVQAKDQPKSKLTQQWIDRSIILLKQFLDATNTPPVLEKSARAQQVVIVPDDTEMMTAVEQNDVNSLLEICGEAISSTEVALEVLRRCASDLQSAINAVFNNPDFVSVIEEQMETKATHMPKVVNEIEAEPVEAYIPPAEILSNDPVGFNCLLGLFEEEELNKNAIWEIVHSLPPNKKLNETLKDLDAPNWEELFDKTSIFKFLYILQIVDGLMSPKALHPTDSQISECKDWCRSFVKLKGFQYLYNMIQHLDINQNTIRSLEYKQCLVYLLKIVHHFMGRSFLKVPGSSGASSTAASPQPTRSLALSQGSSKVVHSQVDFSLFVKTLLELSWNMMQQQPEKSSKEERESKLEALTFSSQLFSSCVVSNPSLMQIFYNFETVKIEQFVLYSLQKTTKDIADLWVDAFSRVCSEFNPLEAPGVLHPTLFFADLLITHYGWDGSQPQHYYQLLAKALELKAKMSITEDKTNFQLFISKIVESIKTCEGDKSENVEDMDGVLNGSLTVLGAYLKSDTAAKQSLGETLLQDVFDICMLHGDMIRSLKCLSSKTRKAAFNLMLELATDCDQNYKYLMKILTPCIQIPTKEEQNKIATLAKSKRGNYVGLLNQGATCYANSLMQQFYMIPDVRTAIFDYQASEEAPPMKRSWLPEVQKMFANLQESSREFYNTTDFINLLQGTFDIRDQQDAFEFFNVACDKLETELKGTTREHILNDVFRVEVKREITCTKEHSTTGVEYFQTLSVEIHKRPNLYEALNGFFEGEKIRDFKCTGCQAEVEITKQLSIKQLPKTLVIHLKRFQFDVETATRKKIYDRFEYPSELDMKRYLNSESISTHTDDQTTYLLKGVVVHKGSADSGHYYSFIQDRTSLKWFKFDDKTISDFNVKSLDKETFGAADYPVYGCGMGFGWNRTISMTSDKKNAYILIYEQLASKNMWIEKPKIEAPPQLSSEIKSENSNSVKLRLRCDPVYFDFLKDVIHRLQFEPVSTWTGSDFIFETIQKATNFVFETVISSSTDKFESWVATLSTCMKKHIPACKWFLTTLLSTGSDSWLMKNLVLHQTESVRKHFSNLIVACLNNLDSHETNIKFEKPERETASQNNDNVVSLNPALATYLRPQFMKFADKTDTVEAMIYVIKNILSDPRDVQYRILSVQTQVFQDCFAQVEGATNFLLHCGFKTSNVGPEVYWLEHHDDCLLRTALSILQKEDILDKLAQSLAQAVPEVKPLAPPAADLPALMQTNVSATFLWYLVTIMEDVRTHWRTFHEYWAIFENCTQMSHRMRVLLMSFDLQVLIMDQYMGSHSPEWGLTHGRKSRVPLGISHCVLDQMLMTLAHLVRACHNEVSTLDGVPPPQTSYPGCPLLPLDEKAKRFIFAKVPAVLDSLLGTAYCPSSNKIIFAHFACNDVNKTGEILSGLSRNFASSVLPSLLVYEGLLDLTDPFSQMRTHQIIDILIEEMNSHGHILKSMARWINTYPAVAEYLLERHVKQAFFKKLEVHELWADTGSHETMAIKALKAFFAENEVEVALEDVEMDTYITQ